MSDNDMVSCFCGLKDRLAEIGDIADRAANGGLNRAGHKATVGELKTELRRIRDLARKEGES